LSFNLFVWIKYGFQSSISASINVLGASLEKAYYSLFIWGIAFPMIILCDTKLGVIAGTLLAIDGAAVSGGDKLQNFLHCFGADAGITLGMVMLILDFHLWPLVLLFVLFTLWAIGVLQTGLDKLHITRFRLPKMNYHTTWIEVAAYVIIMFGIFITRII
jgi:hypothetical protein